MQTIPETPLYILAPPTVPVRVTPLGRFAALATAAACLAVLVVAAYLAPDPAGIGTTTRLGMVPCGFRLNTGLPCAGCGLTTSFNHAVRWEWLKAIWVQPFGAFLALVTAVTFWVSLYIAASARPVHRLIGRGFTGKAVPLIIGLVGFGIAAWGWKIVTTLSGLDGTNW